MRFLSVDPGEKTGYAIFEDDKPTHMGDVPKEQFYEWLLGEHIRYEHIVCEDYLIRPPDRAGKKSGGFDHQWGRVPTIRVIGAVELFAMKCKAPIHWQMSGILTPGAARFGMPHPKNQRLANRNAISAIIHGKWWWEQEGRYLGRENT